MTEHLPDGRAIDEHGAVAPLPTVDADMPLYAAVETVWAALLAESSALAAAGHAPPTLLRDGVLVRINEAEGVFENYSRASLAERASRVVCFTDRRGNPRYPDPRVLDALLARGASEYPGALRATAVTSVPVFARDGRLIQHPGYDAESGIYYRPAPELEGMPELDTRDIEPENLQAARDLVLDLVADFPFVAESDRAHAVGLMLLPFVRELIPGDTPLHAVTATVHRTGKDKLARTMLHPAYGPIASAPPDVDDMERNKDVISHLLAGDRPYYIENQTEPLRGGNLARALTADGRFNGRILGQSKTAHLHPRLVWVVTGNNLSYSRDIAGRVVPIRLDAQVEQPELRTDFRHKDLDRYVRDSRARLVLAALTIAGHWVNQAYGPDELGARPYMGPLKASYTDWAKVIGGILQEAGIGHFLADPGAVSVEGEEDEGAADFLRAWHGLGVGPITARQLLPHCLGVGALADDLPLELDGLRDARALGQWLGNRKGRVYGGLRLVRTGNTRGNYRWGVEPLGGS